MLDNYNSGKYNPIQTPQPFEFYTYTVKERDVVIINNRFYPDFSQQALPIIDCSWEPSCAIIILKLEAIGYTVVVNDNTNMYNEAMTQYEKDIDYKDTLWFNDLKAHYGIDFINDYIGRIIYKMATMTAFVHQKREIDQILNVYVRQIEQIIKALRERPDHYFNKV